MAEVTIVRDNFGVPHITASKEEDGFFGVGYAQAEDQLSRLLRHCLHLRSEMATVFSAKWAEMDKMMLRWRHVEESRAGFERLPEQLRLNYTSFIAGVERYMDDHPDEVPDWAPPLEPWLPVAIARGGIWWYAIADAIGALMRAEIALDEGVLVHSPQTASNGWVVMPQRTADGSLMLLSDPHADLGGFFEPFEFSIDAGRIRSTGMTCVGGVLPIWGHTRYCAWALTTGGPVTSDCFEVQVDLEDPRRYTFDGQSREMIVHGDFEYTEHNGVFSPVVARRDGVAYVISTPYMHCHELWDEMLYNWHLASGIDDFRDAMRTNGQWAQNVIAGDVHGNAYYVRAGRTPIRPSGVDVMKPIPGNSSETAWLGIHDLDDLVQISNPSCGYIQNCNISPGAMQAETKGTPLAPDDYPAYIYNDPPDRTTTRSERCIELFEAAQDATHDDGLSWALDEKWIRTENWQRALAAANPPKSDMVDRLLSFDGYATADSVAANNYFYWRASFGVLLEDVSPEHIRDAWEAVEAGKDLSAEQSEWLVRALEVATKRMIDAHGSTELTYGDVHRVGRGGKSYPGRSGFFMTRRPVGDEDRARLLLAPLRLMEYGQPDENGLRWGWWGPRNLSFVIFPVGETGPIRSYACLAYGQRPDPDSPHHSDQAKLFSEHKLRSTYWNANDLAEHTVSTKTVTR